MLCRNLIFSGLLAFTPPLGAQESAAVDGPKGRFQDDLLSKLEGDWSLTRNIRGTEEKNTVRASWVLNHQFLQIHMKDVNNPPAYEALVLIGFIHSSGQYTAHWCDTFGGKFSAIGTGVRTGNSIEFKFNYPDGPFFNTFTWLPNKKQWVMRLESQATTGARKPFATDTLDFVK
jgi:hypothetical protein